MNLQLPQEQVQEIFDYLTGQPWIQVNHLIRYLSEARPVIEEVDGQPPKPVEARAK